MNANRTALITGANKGIGLETARQLGQQGITVLVGARDADKGKKATEELRKYGIDAHATEIDVSDPASIEKAAKQIERDFGRLDILVNNAGIMIHEAKNEASAQSLAAWRETFATNVFGLIATTNAFLPLLRRSEAGRIVNLSSILGSITLHAEPGSVVFDSKSAPAYDVSKAAVNAYTVHLAYELRNTNVKVNSAHPGWVKTEMGGEGAVMEIEDGAKTSVALATLGADGPNGAFLHDGAPLPW